MLTPPIPPESFLGRLDGLEVLELHHGYDGKRADLAPIRSATALHTLRLNLSWPTSLEPLRGHPALTSVVIPRWSMRYAQVPTDLQALVSSP